MLYFRYANADPEIRKAAIYKNRNGGKNLLTALAPA